ncbi:lysine histidine transporter-like 8 isoform X2 [Hevea brasiliensis]|uniref:lysine histidine transporter-like 8 isoform X2 n=1 Tax=Hevea brasiliensis TaxID=3981 RepID=UPI0025D7DF57|nr:lysine histidine transporter-like 8 isoform X2 [Hevea brasiliensis]
MMRSTHKTLGFLSLNPEMVACSVVYSICFPQELDFKLCYFLWPSLLLDGPKLGKLVAIFPVMYLSGGTCVILIITGSRTMKLFYDTVCGGGASCDAKLLTGAEWFLVFTCVAIVLAQRPNLNSIAGFSFVAAITAVGYYTLIWVSTFSKGRPYSASHVPLQNGKSGMDRVTTIFNALGIIALSFRGHNLVLEIQGTLPSSSKHPSSKSMWKGVLISYLVIALCMFPLAIAGFWAYGNKIPTKVGNLSIFLEFYSHNASKFMKGVTYMLVIINCFTSFQIYAMPVFDNFELRYTSFKNKRCSRWVRTGLRLFFGGLAYLIAVAFPFLPSLAGVIGGMALPLTFAYPCFMLISIKKPQRSSPMWCLNLGLGCLGLLLSLLIVIAAVWTLATKGFHANFFKP